MECKYTYNGVEYGSYLDLLSELSKSSNYNTLADILFSQESKQQAVFDKIAQLSKDNLSLNTDNMQLIDGSPDVDAGGNRFTSQTFIDSAYFKVDGEPPIFQLKTEDYVETMKERLVKQKEMTAEQAEAWGNLVQDKWNDIAENACVFHKLMLSPPTSSVYEWSQRTQNTAFSSLSNKIKELEHSLFNRVIYRNGHDIRGDGGNKYFKKNINLIAPLKNGLGDIVGHIDYMVVKENGDVEIFNIKTSTEPYSAWSAVKKEKYKYQMALIKQMLAYHGINSKRVSVNIIPVRIKYDSQFASVQDIDVSPTIALDTMDMKYTFEKYDTVAAQFIDSNADFSQINLASLTKVNAQLQHIFPGKDVRTEGIRETAKEWLDRNWSYCSPEAQPNGGYQITIPGTKDTITVSDPRRGSKNEELVNIIQSRMDAESNPLTSETGAYKIRKNLEESLLTGEFKSSRKGENYRYLKTVFSKYLDDYSLDEDDKKVFNWKVIQSDVLDAANIIALRRNTGQVDVFTVSGTNTSTKFSFKGRDNLLGTYLPDMNDERFEMKCNYGNIDAVRTVAILNEILPDIGGDIELGQLTVLGLNGFTTKKGTYYEFDQLLKQWDTIVKVVNQNTPANIENNFQKSSVKCVAPETVLLQTWSSIVNDPMATDISEIKDLDDIINSKVKVDGTVVEGIMNADTVEQKIIKLEQLIDRLRTISEERGLNVQDTKELINAASRNDKTIANIAKLYITAMQALSAYYGDTSINTEDFSQLEEYSMKTTSIGNDSVRRVGFLAQKSIDNIRSEILDEMSEITPIFREFYEASGYSSLQNEWVGDLVTKFNNLYEVDEDGNKLMVFKNPYNPNADLKPYERTFLKKILFQFYKVRRRMEHSPMNITGIDDETLINDMPKGYLWVPLQAASKASKRANLKNNLDQFGKKLHRLIARPSEVFEEELGNLDATDVESRDNSINSMRTYNSYMRSYTSLQERDLYIATKGKGFFETNVENIFVDFLAKQVQCDEFNKLLVRVNGIELALTMKGIAENDTKGIDHIVKTIDDFVTVNVHNKSLMEKRSQKIDSFLAPLRRLVSKVFIAANPAGAVRDTMQGLMENFRMAALKYKTDIDMKDVAFGYKEVMKEGSTNIMSMTKLNQFNIKYGFSNFDAAKVADRLKTSRTGILNYDSMMYWTLRAPDYLNRMTLFVAKLHHDGAYDAYSLDENHRLKYDWKKDKRFAVYASGDQSHPKYAEQQALYYSTIRAFNMERSGEKLNYTDDLPDAYTPAQIRAIKVLGESIYGAYDQASKSKYEHMVIGRNFLGFSTWLNGIMDSYFAKRQVSQSELKLEQETDYNGNPLYFADDFTITTENTGKPVTRYVPVMIQGILPTFQEAIKELRNNDYNLAKFWHSDHFKSAVNRRNYRKFFADMALFALLTYLVKMLFTPEYKKHKLNGDGRKIMENLAIEILYKGGVSSFDTMAGPLAVLEYLGESTNPTSYTIPKKALSDAYGLLFGEKTLGQVAMSSQALLRSAQDSYRMYMRDSNGGN